MRSRRWMGGSQDGSDTRYTSGTRVNGGFCVRLVDAAEREDWCPDITDEHGEMGELDRRVFLRNSAQWAKDDVIGVRTTPKARGIVARGSDDSVLTEQRARVFDIETVFLEMNAICVHEERNVDAIVDEQRDPTCTRERAECLRARAQHRRSAPSGSKLYGDASLRGCFEDRLERTDVVVDRRIDDQHQVEAKRSARRCQ